MSEKKMYKVTIELAPFEVCVAATSAEEARETVRADAQREFPSNLTRYLISPAVELTSKEQAPESWLGEIPLGNDDGVTVAEWFASNGVHK